MRAVAAAYSHVRPRQDVYFEGSKKGEVNQLRILLKNCLAGKGQATLTEVIKKVIAYTTLGVDTSRLFPEMILASSSSDISDKKLIYFYLTIYAEEYSDVAVMAINTYFKDSVHHDYRVRGASVKSLCSLKFKGAIDYIQPVIKQALVDPEAYVRRCGVLGIAKAFYLNPQIKSNIEIVDKLYSMIRDDDKLVAINAIQTLNEILAADGGMVVTEKMVAYLLKNLHTFNDFGQIVILEQIQKYSPVSDEEMFQIMNLIDARLKQSSSAVILATIKIFVKYATQKEGIYKDVLERIRDPMITLMACHTDEFEIQFVVLEHILYLVSVLKGREIFHKFYKNFFCLAHQPTYIKTTKISILRYLASDFNIADIFAELEEYVGDVNDIVARKAINALGEIGLQVPIDYSRLIIKILLKKLQIRREDICNETALVFRDILRRFPDEYTLVLNGLDTIVELAKQDAAKCAILYIIDCFGEHIPYATEYAQLALDCTSTIFDAYSLDFKRILLRTCVSLFLKLPSQVTKQTLGKIFVFILNNEKTDVSLKDQAALYYRAMQANLDEFSHLFLSHRDYANINEEVLAKFNFNTLELIYKKSEHLFVKDVKSFGRMFGIELTDEIMEGGNMQQPQIQIDVNPRFKILEAEDFDDNYTLEPEKFEAMWGELQEGACITRMIENPELMTEENIEELFKLWRISTIAMGEEDGTIKAYLYTKVRDRETACMQLEVNRQVGTLMLMTKCENEELAGFVSKYIEEFLKINEFIRST